MGARKKMIENCNFKSKIRHPEAPGCNLTPNDVDLSWRGKLHSLSDL